jgi:hypothetical protein
LLGKVLPLREKQGDQQSGSHFKTLSKPAS